jgi:hypothetical protein
MIISDFGGNPLVESEYKVPLSNYPAITGSDDNNDLSQDQEVEQDDDNNSKDALI